MKRLLCLGFMVVQFVCLALAQNKVPCYSGSTYPSCTPEERTAKVKKLAKAKSVAVIIKATQGIACGDGSDGCFKTDSQAVSLIQQAVGESGLWQNLTRADAKTADILLNFTTKDRASLQLCAYDADSNDLLWCDYRDPSIALDNDALRELAHFVNARIVSKK